MWGRLTDRLGRSGLAVLGSGAVELAAKALFDSPGVLDTTLGVVAASAAINLGIQNRFVLAGSQVLFLVVSFYAFLPSVLPGDASQRAAREPPYRATLALVAGVYSLPVVLLSTGVWTAAGWTGGLLSIYLVAATALTLAVTAAFLRGTQREALIDPSGKAHAIIPERRYDSASTPLGTWLSASLPQWHQAGTTIVVATSVAASHVIPMILFGLLGGALNAVFPVLELVVLCGLLLRFTGDADADSRLSSAFPEIEDTFYDHLTVVTRGSTGAAGAITAVLGVIAPVGSIVVLLNGGYLTPRYAISAWGLAFEYLYRWLFATVRLTTVFDGLVAAVAATGELLSIPIAATAAVWFWFREIQRLPALQPATAADGESTAPPETVPARPVGMLLPAAALALARTLEIELSVGSLRGALSPGTVELLFASSWPLLTLLVFATIRRTPTGGQDAESVVVLSEGPPMFVAFGSTLVIAYALVTPLWRLLPLTVVVVLLLSWLYYLTPVDRWAGAHADRPARLVVAYGLVLVSITVPAVALDVAPPILLGLLVVPVFVALGHRSPEESTQSAVNDADDPDS
ncbi:hypothetical protein [Halobellus salinisoli]|uniref:hypothetical protein n=1 Tax=Halobellus salinisoli TaxID=3108500 RepID=UPI003009DA65